MKKFKVIVIEEEVAPKFIVPTSNFEDAYLIGVPCEVISEPYIDKYRGERREVIDVKSCVTGLEYTIPTGWAMEFDTLPEANEESKVTGFDQVFLQDIIGSKYYPKDNSYIRDFHGVKEPLYHKVCEIVSVPFKDKTEFGEKDFILVKYNGKVYRTLWEEWCLYPY